MNTAPFESQELREDRGVIRDTLAPAGYVGYIAMASDGVMVGHEIIRVEIDTPARKQLAVDRLWLLIDEWEEIQAVQSPLPSPGLSLGPRLLS